MLGQLFIKITNFLGLMWLGGVTVGSDIGCWLIFSWSSAIGALFSTASPVNCALVAREDKKSCNFRKRDLDKRFQQDLKVQRSSNGSFGGYWVCCFGSRNPFWSSLLYTWWQRENYRYWSSHQYFSGWLFNPIINLVTTTRGSTEVIQN